MVYEIQTYPDPKKLAEGQRDLLLREEVTNALMLGLIDAAPPADEGTLALAITLNNNIVGCAYRSCGAQPLILTPMPKNATVFLAGHMQSTLPPLKGVTGPEKTIKAFNKEWEAITETPPKTAMNLGVYTSAKKLSPPPVPGKALVAGGRHQEQLEVLFQGFVEDAFPEENDIPTKARQLAEKHIHNNTALMWLDEAGTPVAVAVKQRQTPNTATISAVYTHQDHRGNGYGKAVVSALNNMLLGQGYKKCVLMADLDNPITPDFYKKLGYTLREKMPRYILKE